MSAVLISQIQIYFANYGFTTCLILGTIGNISLIFVFKNQRENTCSIYLLTAAIMNIIFLTFNVPLHLYTYAYGDPTSRLLIFCKLRHFLIHGIGQIARYSIVLACIDRFVCTSHSVHLRVLSRPIVARILSICLCIIVYICAIHISILTTITNGCCGQFPPYFKYYITYIIIFVSTLPPVLMTIFGYLAYRNVSLLHIRIQPVRNSIHHDRNIITIDQRDRELLKMVLAEAFFYIITMTIHPTVLLEMTITNNMNMKKSTTYVAMENFLIFMGILMGYLNSAVPFYIYLIASKAFRERIKKFFKCLRRRTIEPRQIPIPR